MFSSEKYFVQKVVISIPIENPIRLIITNFPGLLFSNMVLISPSVGKNSSS